MKLYLVQHGAALPEEEDPQRPLSPEGIRELGKTAAFLKENKVKAGHIWHSKKLRAVQTAGIVAEAIKGAKLREREDLNPMDPVDKFPAELAALGDDLVIVGHLPFLQKLASLLLTGAPEKELIAFCYAGVVCLELNLRWEIEWFVTPELTGLILKGGEMAKKKILVVDDEEGLVAIIRMKLKQEGYNVVTAADGQEGVDKAKAEKPDLILMDVSMPKMSGGEALARLKKDKSTQSIPVIMLTGKSEVEDIVRFMTEGGAKDYIVKPFFTEDILTKIYSVLYKDIEEKVRKTLDEKNKK